VLVKLLIIDAVRSLDLAVKVRRPRPDVHMTDIQSLQVPMEVRLKLRPVVRLHDVHTER
jgi:hypothetical protein